jgi:MarR family transcriptional regulator, organic hydroperoxide resistance regulator
MDQPTSIRAQMPVADQIVDALRVYAADDAAVTHRLARWLGVNAADAQAFGQVLYSQNRGTPLSPSVLAHRLNLTSGATATLINRLEAAGLVIRSREHRDRRIVTLRIEPDVKQQVLEFFAPLADRVDVMMKNHPEELLHAVVALLDDLHAAIAGVVEGFDQAPQRRDPPVSGA